MNTPARWITACLCFVACDSSSAPAPEQSGEGASSDPSAASSDPQTSGDAPEDDTAPQDDDAPTTCSGERQTVTFTTSDDTTLEADFHPAGTGELGAVLLHMIPPSNDRTNYPPSFITALNEAGYAVLNVDRRGAGGSEGVPEAAYEGEAGRLDAVAAMTYLRNSACAVAPSSTVIIGASNGTTTALDYTVSADEGDRPRALVFLSPGQYTENQNQVAEHAALLGSMPIFFGYPDSERGWPQGVRELDGGRWRFVEYAGGGHGSRLFESSPQVVADIIDFLGS